MPSLSSAPLSPEILTWRWRTMISAWLSRTGTISTTPGQSLKGRSNLIPNMAEAHYTLGISWWQAGDFDRTIAQMKDAVRLRPDYGEAWFILGTALKQKGQLTDALSALREAVRLRPEDPGPFNTLGQTLRLSGDLEGSKAAFAQGAKVKAAKEAQLADMMNHK